MKIEFNEQQLKVIKESLAEIPYYLAMPVFIHINQQIKEQQALEFDARREESENHPQL